MPATYVIDEARRLVLSEASGVLTAAEMFDHQQCLCADPAFQPDFQQLFDFTKVIETKTSIEDVRRLAAESPFRAGARRAFVVARPVCYGLARMFQMLTEKHKTETEIFGDMEEARRWLGLEP
jgi:hypothetical protein